MCTNFCDIVRWSHSAPFPGRKYDSPFENEFSAIALTSSGVAFKRIMVGRGKVFGPIIVGRIKASALTMAYESKVLSSFFPTFVFDNAYLVSAFIVL